MKTKAPMAVPAVGGSSLLVIFAVLCLTVFALLTLTAVQADGRLQQAEVQGVTNYYAAEGAAQQILARLREGIVPDGVTQQGSVFSYMCPISENQSLAVTVRVEGQTYQVLRWQTVYAGSWQPDTGLPVWSGTETEGES